MSCGFSQFNVPTCNVSIEKIQLMTEYSGLVTMFCSPNELFTVINDISIKVIDINEYQLNADLTYSLSYLRTLKAKKIEYYTECYDNDILYNVYEYILFLKDHNIKFNYHELFILSNVKDLDNAYWNGSYLTFGNGTINCRPLTSPAIIGHELTHALIQSIGGLKYYAQSGALNEAYADIFGVMFEFWLRNKRGIGFELGSECFFDHHSMRSFRDPNSCGQPAYMYDKYYCITEDDNAGVHINSGIINHLFYKMQLNKNIVDTFIIFIKVLYELNVNSTFMCFKQKIIKYLDEQQIMILNTAIY
jgi:Zn-dependent metalloprotease